MAPAKPRDDEGYKDKDKPPSSPRRTSPANNNTPAAAKRSGNNGVATPLNRRNSGSPMPKSAPAASGAGGVRKNSTRKHTEPSLLGDFLLGRPSPARVAAARRRSADAAAVRAELRQQMRQDAIRRVQQPGKVEARVKAWQKANAAAMAEGNPEDAASEPTEVAVHIDAESVTEEDRVRIKSRQKPKRKSSSPKSSPTGKSDDTKDETGVKRTSTTAPKEREKAKPKEYPFGGPRLKNPPKKRIVSDDNWMKRNKAYAAQKAAGAGKKPAGNLGPSPIPKDFLQRTYKTPKMQDKIKEWAKRIEVPESPAPPRIPKSSGPTKRYSTKSGDTITVEESASGVSGPVRSQASRNIITVEEAASGVSSTERSQASHNVITVEEEASTRSDSTRTWSERTGGDGIRIRATGATSPRVSVDDGIRIRPLRNKTPGPLDDGLRVRPARTSPLPDDGIRVRPLERASTEDAISRSASPRKTSRERTLRVPSTRRERTPPATIEVIEEPETEIETPTKKSTSRRPSRMMQHTTATATTMTETETTLSDESQSWTSDESDSRADSVRPSSAPAKSLADIPFGYSAFSVLELPVGADHHHIKRPRSQQRTSSFRAVPKAFRKIVTGAKEIVVHERAELPKPATNKPPSIESWLNGTVDPFVDQAVPKTPSLEEIPETDIRRQAPAEPQRQASMEPRRRASVEPRRRASVEPQRQASVEPRRQAPAEPRQKREPATHLGSRQSRDEQSRDDDDSQTEVPDRPTEPYPKPTVGLKRSKATRNSISPSKHAPGKKPLREALSNLFKGESSGHKFPTKAYSSYEDVGPDSEISYMEEAEDVDRYDSRRYSMGPRERSPSPVSSYVSTDISSNTGGPYMSPAIPRRQPPPTNGGHELSTIASEESESTYGSETLSTISESTVTQTTGITRSTAISRRSKGSGLKRRLTKHSDLVSVLSLPDDADTPLRSRSIRSTSSLRRRTSKLGRVTVEDLLREFAVDEDFYQRELKTLVDGAIPVLLNQVVKGNREYAMDLFGPSTDGRADIASKTVVNIGIALEKLRNLHNRAPLHDVNRILTWLLTAYPIYNRYLDVWRLGFEGIVVNLAPSPGKADDEDSLVNAMPRNEYGDVVDTQGQPVDLQRLLTRPLARIKGLLKLLRGAQAIGNQHPELSVAIDDFSTLQEKARKRHRQEVARKTDEDAITTDTTRCCDLRTLNFMERVLIDPSRQVNAKDFFSLDLSHSSGQRVECQVELVYRDKPKDPLDKGDILIRDVGHSRCSLMFPPIPKTAISARTTEDPCVLVCMIRGRHNGREWYETFTLSTDLEDQVLDWIDILPTTPVPPSTIRGPIETNSAAYSPKSAVDVPLGVRTGSGKSRKGSPPQLSPRPRTPSHYQSYHETSPDRPTTPTSPTSSTSSLSDSPSPDRTPTQKTSRGPSRPRSLPVIPPKAETTPLHEDMRPDPLNLIKSSSKTETDGEHAAPSPPVHRTFSSKTFQTLSPPVDLNPPSRMKRRGSSPLKHEFRPSDVSSSSSETDSDSASDVESSSDELDEVDVPDTQPAISIKQDPQVSALESTVSDNSIAPSQSASQVGLYGRLGPGGAKDPEYIIKSIASISYWSDKQGQWREVLDGACSIVITPGLIEAYPLATHSASTPGALNSSGSSETAYADPSRMQPLIALELTPIVLIRQSTALDLEVRSPVRPYCKLSTIDGKIFRFRAPSADEGSTLYTAVHQARLNNAKYKALEEEARFRSFGQAQTADQPPDSQASSGQRRSWFGRKNSYRASTRAPSQSVSQSQGTASSISAPSLLKRLTGGGDLPFNINKSSIDRHRRSASGIGGLASLYTSGSSSGGGMTPPRSPSISLAGASGRTQALGNDNLKIRCHLLVTPTKWEDYGNCKLQITRPPPGMRQELRIRHGMEKRVIVTKIPKKTFGFGSADPDKEPVTILDVVLGSKCFGRLGSRGIILNVWGEVRDENNNIGLAPAKGGLSGKVTKWCFQCSSATEASWIFGLVAQEVDVGLADPLLPPPPW
ncbi:hypothetical protein VPNG_05542 [Cytospora leucostoma]|uniref:DH domain-containing protein n=1 Tax=Cytospora leucostoma TaxID=1230097 RepID=A0A423X721_9PEZI|nr:hypothetical protein VPNG_05542 [Cytospora leucostoma]